MVTKVALSETLEPLQLTITTISDAATPKLTIFGLREPDRIVADLPGFTWQAGVTARMQEARGFLRSLRVGQFSQEPPVTRLVLDVAGPASAFAYHLAPGQAASELILELKHAPASSLPAGWEFVAPAAGNMVAKPGSEFDPASNLAMEYRTLPEYDTAAQIIDQQTSLLGQVSPPEIASPIAGIPSTGEAASPTAPADGRLLRYVLAFTILLVAGFLAVYIRRRFQFVVAFDPAAASPPEPDEIPSRGPALETRADDIGQTPPVVNVTEPESVILEEEIPVAAGSSPLERARQFVEVLGSSDTEAYPAAIQSLVELAVEGPSGVLLEFLEDARPQVRAMVAGVIGEAGTREGIPAVARLLNDPAPAVKASALYALARFGEAAAAHADTARKLLVDNDNATREMAVEAVSALVPYSELAAQEIVNLLSDPEPSVREAAALAVLQYSGRGIDTPIIDLLSDFSRRAEALLMLQQADEGTLWQLLDICRSCSLSRARISCDTVLYTMKIRWTAQDFTEDLAHPDPSVRVRALTGLGIVGDQTALQMIRQAAETDPATQVRTTAKEILAELTAPEQPSQTPPVILRNAASEA
jgi:HEAT repeat protein